MGTRARCALPEQGCAVVLLVAVGAAVGDSREQNPPALPSASLHVEGTALRMGSVS